MLVSSFFCALNSSGNGARLMESQFARRPWKWRFFGSKGFLFREDPLFFPMQENETIRRPLNRSTTRCHVLSTSEITVAPFPPPSTPFRNVTRAGARNRNGPLFLSRQLKLLPSFPEHCPRANCFQQGRYRFTHLPSIFSLLPHLSRRSLLPSLSTELPRFSLPLPRLW